MTALELLAPARDLQCALQAIAHGADAVYIGGPSHGARSRAANSIDDIRQLCEAARPYGVKIYVTLNTLVYPDERAGVRDMVRELWHAGVDALIVQDTGLLDMDLPPIDLHASTQCDIRTPERARQLAALGFSRLVLPRELTLDETRAIADAVPGTELEAFVHGALCVCYSGDCRAGYVVAGRSANRGECPQLCRLPYTLTDGSGRILMRDAHLLSLRDLDRSGHLAALARNGVCSFKIEGRLKDAAYVKETTAAYSRLLDRLVEAHPDLWRRASYGRSTPGFTPDLNSCFNRGYTDFFTTSAHLYGQPVHMAGFDAPARRGTDVGTVLDSHGTRLHIRPLPDVVVSNGDGLSWDNGAEGLRVNRVEPLSDGTVILHLLHPVKIAPDTLLRRTFDAARSQLLEQSEAVRTLRLSATLRPVAGNRMALNLSDETGRRISVTAPLPPDTAVKPQLEARHRVLSKTGNTPWRLTAVEDKLGNTFVPASVLTSLRREAMDLLASLRTGPRRLRPVKSCFSESSGPSDRNAPSYPEGRAPAALRREGVRVMTSRYCIRRECGRCLRSPQGRLWRGPLYLSGPGGAMFRAEFDCDKCRMHLFFDSHTPS